MQQAAAIATVAPRAKSRSLDGTHLCLVRLNLLRLNTIGPAPPAALQDAAVQPHFAKQP